MVVPAVSAEESKHLDLKDYYGSVYFWRLGAADKTAPLFFISLCSKNGLAFSIMGGMNGHGGLTQVGFFRLTGDYDDDAQDTRRAL